MMTTPFLEYFFFILLVWETELRQGRHQVAQKSRTTIFPLSEWRSSGLKLIHSFSTNSGVGLLRIALSASRDLLDSRRVPLRDSILLECVD